MLDRASVGHAEVCSGIADPTMLGPGSRRPRHRQGPFVCGEQFTMADTVLGGKLRYMVRFEMLKPSATIAAYCERLGERPALKRAEAKNAAIAKEHGPGER